MCEERAQFVADSVRELFQDLDDEIDVDSGTDSSADEEDERMDALVLRTAMARRSGAEVVYGERGVSDEEAEEETHETWRPAAESSGSRAPIAPERAG